MSNTHKHKLKRRRFAEAQRQAIVDAPIIRLHQALAEVNAAPRLNYRAQILLMDAISYLANGGSWYAQIKHDQMCESL